MALTSPRNSADQTVVAAKLYSAYGKLNRIAQLTNTEYTGVIKGVGSVVKVNSLADVTVGNYIPGTPMTRQALTPSAVSLTIDQAKYINFGVDDTDSDAGSAAFLEAAATRGAEILAETYDLYLATQWAADAGVTAGLGTTGTPISLATATAAYEYLVTLRSALKDTKGDLAVVVPTEFVGKLLLDSRFVGSNQAALYNGEVGRAAGFTIIESNVLVPASGKYTILARSDREAVASAMTIDKVERYRPEDSFEDAMKALSVYGGKVMRPLAAAKGVVTF
jgi:hypothetical protein